MTNLGMDEKHIDHIRQNYNMGLTWKPTFNQKTNRDGARTIKLNYVKKVLKTDKYHSYYILLRIKIYFIQRSTFW